LRLRGAQPWRGRLGGRCGDYFETDSNFKATISEFGSNSDLSAFLSKCVVIFIRSFILFIYCGGEKKEKETSNYWKRTEKNNQKYENSNEKERTALYVQSLQEPQRHTALGKEKEKKESGNEKVKDGEETAEIKGARSRRSDRWGWMHHWTI
jgi:hypothetical protein